MWVNRSFPMYGGHFFHKNNQFSFITNIDQVQYLHKILPAVILQINPMIKFAVYGINLYHVYNINGKDRFMKDSSMRYTISLE